MTPRLLLLAAPLAVALVAPHADAAVRARTQHGAYTTGANVAGVISGDVNVNNDRLGAVSFGTLRRDRSFEIAIADDAGLPVLAEVTQDVDGDGKADYTTVICGATTAPVAVRGKGAVVTVYVLTGECGGSVSVPTTGTVTATFRP